MTYFWTKPTEKGIQYGALVAATDVEAIAMAKSLGADKCWRDPLPPDCKTMTRHFIVSPTKENP